MNFTAFSCLLYLYVVDFLPTKLNIKKADVSSPSSFGEPKQNSSNTSAFNTTVPQNGTGVNSYDMRNGGENSQFSFGDGTDNYRNHATSSKTKKVAKIATLEMLPTIIR